MVINERHERREKHFLITTQLGTLSLQLYTPILVSLGVKIHKPASAHSRLQDRNWKLAALKTYGYFAQDVWLCVAKNILLKENFKYGKNKEKCFFG